MFTLIGSPKNRSFRILWMLEEVGAQYEIVQATPHSKEMLAANPSGKAPALKAGDDIIIDSVAGIQYLADKHQQFTAAPGTIERAKQDSFTCLAMDEFDGVLWTNAKHDFALPEDLRQTGVNAACQWELARTMKVLEQRLGANEYVTGDQFTVPDLILGHCGGWMKRAGFDWPAGKVTEYFDRVQARPAFQKAAEIRDTY